MAWTMPAPPPGLADLLKRGGQLPPNPFGAASPQQPAPMAPSGQDAMRAAIIPQQAAAPAQAAAPPPPSDDPAISPVPAPPDISNSPIAGLQKQMADTSTQIAAVPHPDPAKLRPKLWERLAGAGTAFAAGWKDPALGYEVGSNVTNRRFNQAQSDYKQRVSPLQQQLQAEREQVPVAEAAAKIPQNAWENRMKQHQEERETFTAKANQNYKSDLNDIRTMLDNNKHDEALQKINEAAEKNKNNLDVQNQLLDLKNQALELKRQQIENGIGQKGQLTDNQKVGIENRKAQALQHAEASYRKAIGLLTPTDEQGKKDALDQLNQDKQAAQDNYENEISAAGGSPSHMDVNAPKSTPQAAPAATPQATNAGVSPDLWKGKEGKRLIMSDGSKWELQSGKPVQVSAPTKK